MAIFRVSYLKVLIFVAIVFAIVVGAGWALQQPVHLQVACVTKPGKPLLIQIPADAELLGQIPDGMSRNVRELTWAPTPDQSGQYTLELLWGNAWRRSRMTCQISVTALERTLSPELSVSPQGSVPPERTEPVVQQLKRPKIVAEPVQQPEIKDAIIQQQPQFLTTPVTRISAGQLWSYQPRIKVANGNEAKLVLRNGPPGMVLDKTQTLKWTPGNDAVGQVEVSLLASDQAQLCTWQNFTLSSDALFKVGSIGDWPQTIQPLDNGVLLGLSHARLMLLPGDLTEVMDSYWTPSRLARTFLYHKGYVFLGQDNLGTDIFDVRDGKHIIPRGRIPVVNRGFHCNAISNDVLIIAGEQDYSLHFFSVADPEKPEFLSKLFMGINKNPYNVRTNGTIAYVHGHKYIAAVDFKDPRQPRVLSEVEISTRGCFGAFVSYPPYLYQFGNERIIVDASKPDQLKVIQTSEEAQEFACLADVNGQRAILYGNGSASILDFADPAMPRTVESSHGRGYQLGAGAGGLYQTLASGRVTLLKGGPLPDERMDLNGVRYEGVATEGHLAYVVGNNIDVVDISNPRQPRRVSSTSFPDGCRDATPLLYDHILFTSTSFWDVRNPEQIKRIQSWKPAQAFASGIGCVYVARGNDIECWKVSEGSAQMLTRWSVDMPVSAFVVNGERVYAGTKTGWLRTYRMTADGLVLLNARNTTTGAYPHLSDLKLEGEFLYLALNSQGVACYSIRDPDKPEYYSHRATGQFANSIVPKEGIAYVADGSGGLKVIDLRNPGEGKLISTYESTDWTHGVSISGDSIVTCDRETGVHVFACHLLTKKGPTQKPQAEPVPVPILKELPKLPPPKVDNQRTDQF